MPLITVRRGAFQPHIKASSGAEPFPPSAASLLLRVPARARGRRRPPAPARQHAPLPRPVRCALAGAASPAPRAAQGERGAAAGAAQEGGWTPARRWAARRHEGFVRSLSPGWDSPSGSQGISSRLPVASAIAGSPRGAAAGFELNPLNSSCSAVRIHIQHLRHPDTSTPRAASPLQKGYRPRQTLTDISP